MKFLDFGCGAGGFLKALLDNNINAFGVDCEGTCRDVYATIAGSDPSAISRWIHYDGALLPFASQTFDMAYSWYVLEHIKDLKQSLKELVRVVKPGGVIALFTQDARSAYDGHVGIPWPPFLHSDFYEAYLAEWDKTEKAQYMKDSVYYVISEEILCILKYFKMNIIYSSEPSQFSPSVSLNIQNTEDARRAAQYFKEMQRIGKWQRPAREIGIIAQK